MRQRWFRRTTTIVLLAGAVLLGACDTQKSLDPQKTAVQDTRTFWTIQAGAAGTSISPSGIAVDPSGTLYVAGTTNGGIDGNTMTGTLDHFVTSYTATKDRMFTRQSGVPGRETGGTGVAVDADGNVYMTGYTFGGLDGNTLSGSNDYFVTKYSPTGGRIYTYQVGVPIPYNNVTSNATSNSIAVDADGTVYVTGETNIGLDGNMITGWGDYFVTKYTPTGNRVYTVQTGAVGAIAAGLGIAADADGNVYVTGKTSGGLDGNAQTGTLDCFVAKYTSTGGWAFTRQTGVPGKYTHCCGLAVDPAGNVFVTGITNGGLDGNTLTGLWDYFVTKYTPTGGRVFTRQRGIAGHETKSTAIAVDAGGNAYVTGSTDGGLDGNRLAGMKDYFVTKFTPTGDRVFTRQSGAIMARTLGVGIAVDATGSVYVAGSTDGGLDNNNLTGMRDYFVAKYDSMGNEQ